MRLVALGKEKGIAPARFVAKLLAATALAVTATSNAQETLQPADEGKRDFESSCAICHGVGGKGDGSYALFHGLKTPDLTLLTTRNRGVFPYRRVAEIIDGRHSTIIHGTPGMPVWGDRYRVKAATECRDTHCDPEAKIVRAHV